MDKDTPPRRQCTAKAKSTGQRCKRRPLRGATVCSKHGGQAPQVKRAAARREREALLARLDEDDVKKTIAALVTFDIRGVITADGKRIKPLEQWTRDQAVALAGMDVSRPRSLASNLAGVKPDEEVVKYKLADRLKALELAAKILGILAPEKQEQTGTVHFEWGRRPEKEESDA